MEVEFSLLEKNKIFYSLFKNELGTLHNNHFLTATKDSVEIVEKKDNLLGYPLISACADFYLCLPYSSYPSDQLPYLSTSAMGILNK